MAAATATSSCGSCSICTTPAWRCSVAALIALPLGVLIGHTGRGGFLVVNLANAWRAIPTLGLLVLLVVLFGFTPLTWLIPLVVLAIPPSW